MPKQYEALKRKYHSKQRAAKIYIGKGKTKKARSQRAKRLHHK